MVEVVVCDRPGCDRIVKKHETYFTINSNNATRIGFHLCAKCMVRAMEPIKP